MELLNANGPSSLSPQLSLSLFFFSCSLFVSVLVEREGRTSPTGQSPLNAHRHRVESVVTQSFSSVSQIKI